jgi:hypothetical protein
MACRTQRGTEHWYPKRPDSALPAFPFFPPYLLHCFIGKIPWRLRPRDRRRPFLQGWYENATSNQSLLLLGAILISPFPAEAEWPPLVRYVLLTPAHNVADDLKYTH